MKTLTLLLSGMIFSAGLVVSGMTRPDKVIGFLDVTGSWDPSLALVMVGAISVHLPLFFLIKKRRTPLLAKAFYIPGLRSIDARLLVGSALFGIGWGLGGYCPGPAVTSIVAGHSTTLLFVAAMIVGMILHRIYRDSSKTAALVRGRERSAESEA